MKKTFPGYYSPSKGEFSKLWKDCVFIFDTNVLLNLYRYTASTSNELIGILRKISDRIWVPYQAALEYQKERLNVISQQSEAYEKIQDRLEETQKKLESELRTYSRHPLIDVDTIIRKISRHFSAIKKDLNKNKQSHPDLIHNDPLRDTITSLFDGNVGSPFSEEQLEEIYEKGDKRYKQSIPPGFSDARKEGIEKYGDLVIWFQIIDKAKEIKKPIIFVTDDRKEDWWYKFKGETIGPHPKLVEEIKSEAEVLFYMYPTERFMKNAQDYLKQKVEQKAIEEVREVQRSLGRNAFLSDWMDSVATSRVRALSDLDRIRDSLAKIPKSDMERMTGSIATSRVLSDLERIRDSLIRIPKTDMDTMIGSVVTSRVRALSDLDRIRDSLAKIPKSDMERMTGSIATSRVLSDLDTVRDSLAVELKEFIDKGEPDKSASSPKKEPEE